MQKAIIDLVVNKININTYRSLVGGKPYAKEAKNKSIRL